MGRSSERWKAAEVPPNEAARLDRLRAYDVLDTAPERDLDDLTRLASTICGTPIALVSLVDERRQWFLSRVGLAATETPREVSFCGHAILAPGRPFVVEDASKDERFAGNPLVVGDPFVRFYAGVPLVPPSGEPLGTLCVLDRAPRTLTEAQIEALSVLARQVVTQLELRGTIRALQEAERTRAEHAREIDLCRRLVLAGSEGFAFGELTADGPSFERANPAARRMFGLGGESELAALDWPALVAQVLDATHGLSRGAPGRG